MNIHIHINSPYIHVITVLLTTAGCGISRDWGKISYGVDRSFGATGLPESRPQPKKKRGGGDRKDSLNKADNETLARGGELPIHPPQVCTQGVRSLDKRRKIWGGWRLQGKT
jgi:hypothetical protein